MLLHTVCTETSFELTSQNHIMSMNLALEYAV